MGRRRKIKNFLEIMKRKININEIVAWATFLVFVIVGITAYIVYSQ